MLHVHRVSGAPSRARTRLGLLLCSCLAAGGALAGTCPVPFFREHSPERPPRILTDTPVRDVFETPVIDADPRPPGTVLTFYRLGRQDAVTDRWHPIILVRNEAGTVLIDWRGSREPAACCTGVDCFPACPLACDGAAGTYMEAGGDCPVDPASCVTGQVLVVRIADPVEARGFRVAVRPAAGTELASVDGVGLGAVGLCGGGQVADGPEFTRSCAFAQVESFPGDVAEASLIVRAIPAPGVAEHATTACAIIEPATLDEIPVTCELRLR